MKLKSDRANIIDLSKSSSQVIVEDFMPLNFNRIHADTEANFKKNLSSQPLDWYYRTHNVRYTMNGQWYRSKPFDQINWSESIVIFGCSNVLGIGIDDDDTISSRLQQLVGCEVVNLGVRGSCQQTSLYNMMILKNNNITPRAIVHVWTESMRIFHINNDFQRCNAAHWNNWGVDSSVKFDMFENSKTHIVSAMFNRMIANTIYNNIPVVHATYFEKMWQEQAQVYPNMPIILLPHLDNARDLLHPGVESSINTANRLAKELIKAGIM